MTVEVKGDNLVITAPIQKNPAPSKSGKTLVVASSHGNVRTTVEVLGKPVTVGFNAFIGK